MVIFFWIYKMGVAVLTSKFDGIIYLFNFMELMPLHSNRREEKKEEEEEEEEGGGDMIKFVAKAIHYKFSL